MRRKLGHQGSKREGPPRAGNITKAASILHPNASKHEPKGEEEEELLPQGKYSMMQYAKDYFRQGQDIYEAKAGGTIGKLSLS